jgi:hypothetical protein
MGCLIAEICALIGGIIAVVTGKFTLTRNKVVRGAPARIVGVLLMVPLPVAIFFSIVVLGALLVRGGFDPTNPTNVPIGLRLIEPAIFVIFFTAALIIAAVHAEPPEPKRRRVREDEEDDEEEEARPRRRADRG